MSGIGCEACGAWMAHCPTCGRPLDSIELELEELVENGQVESADPPHQPAIVVGCTHCRTAVEYCTACSAFLYPPPAADPRRPCWGCRGKGKVLSRLPSLAGPVYLLADSNGAPQLTTCERCKGSGIDPIGKAEPA